MSINRSTSTSNSSNSEDLVHKYDITSRSYDNLYRDEQYAKYSFIFDELAFGVPRVVVDVGCGTGLLIEFLREREIDNYDKYICVEPSYGMLKRLLEKKLLDHRVILVRSYGELLPIPSGVADAVYAFTVWDNVVYKEQFVKEVLRITSPNGYVVISCIAKSRGIKPVDLLKEFEFLGCRIDCFYALYRAKALNNSRNLD